MALAGFQTSLKVGGAPVAVTGEATTSLGGDVYQVTASARRVINPDAAVVVYDNGSPVAATDFTLDLLFGKVAFLSTPSGPVTLDYEYIPLATLTECFTSTFSGTADLGDTTAYGDTFRAKKTLLLDVSGSLTTRQSPRADIDAVTGGTQSVVDRLESGETFVLEADFGSGAFVIRAWVKLESGEVTAAVDGLVETSWTFQGSNPPNAPSVSFGP